MHRILICLIAVVTSFTVLHQGNTGIHIDPRDYDSFEEWSNAKYGISKEQEEEDEKKRQAYLSRYKDDEAADTESIETDTSLADSFIVGTAVSVIVSVISWAVNKHKNRK